uniref:Major facilitator superfamily (MFS) profile domain-containing protein n=1 Tax=Plectus sambesii TaxID=2011161 RepID=A0A914VBZ8_9BILA
MKERGQSRFPLNFDEIFERIKSYGWYQLFFLLTVQYACIPQAGMTAGGFFSLGGLIPTYTCSDNGTTVVFDKSNITQYADEACIMVKTCRNLTVDSVMYSMYEEFQWMCVPSYLMPTMASIMPIAAITGFLIGGHISDHFGRKWLTIIGLGVNVLGGLVSAIAPNWQFYMVVNFINQLTQPIYYGAAFALCMESIGTKWRLIQSFAFQWSLGYIFAGLGAYLTRHWRIFNIVVNGVGIPCVLMMLLTEESPRWLVQKQKYRHAAQAINKIARWNGRDHIKYTEADMKAIDLSSKGKRHNYNIYHLFSQKKLAIYCVSQIVTGICINTVGNVILFNVQDLAGSPFLNVALMGIMRLWVPLAAIAMERYSNWFGRKPLLIGSQATVCICFTCLIIIHTAGYWETLHWLATGLALFGYGVEIGLVWVAYKTYTTELFPTVIRTIALNTFSLSSNIGTALAPQLIYLRYYWHPMPYAGAAVMSLASIIIGVAVLPETKGQPMPDSLEEIKEGRLLKIDARSERELDLILPKNGHIDS